MFLHIVCIFVFATVHLYLFSISVINRNHRNASITPTSNQLMNSTTKQVNKVKPNVNRAPADSITSPGYNNR